jgi:hypothetical protein
MKELGIHPAEYAAKAPADPDMDWFRWLIKYWGQERKGKSTLKKWCCPECGLNVRMGIAGDPKLRHHTCEEAVGRPVFLVHGDVYVAKKETKLDIEKSVVQFLEQACVIFRCT